MDLNQTVVFPAAGALIVAPFLPLLVALVTKYRPSGQRLPQAIAAIVLSAVVTVVALLLDDDPDTLGSVVGTFAGVFAAQLGAYLGVWQNIGKASPYPGAIEVPAEVATTRPSGINAILAPDKGI